MDIRSVGIVGTGVMGLGIARAAFEAGYPVTIVKWTDGSVNPARDAFERKLAPEKLKEAMGRVTWADTTGALYPCDLIIESIVEDSAKKLECIADISRIARGTRQDAVIASNTSTLSIADLALAAKRPDLFLGLHFFNPVHAMELVEVPVADGTDPEAIQAAVGFARALGKQPFVVRDSPGFVVNRLFMSSPLEAIRMAFEDRPRVADIETIDACVRLGLKHPMGPFQLMDHVGLDIIDAMAVSLQEGLRRESFSPPRFLERMVDRGWLGRKSGLGFYDYSDRKNPRPNPGLEKLAS